MYIDIEVESIKFSILVKRNKQNNRFLLIVHK